MSLRDQLIEVGSQASHVVYEEQVRGIEPHWDVLADWAKDHYRVQAEAALDAFLDVLEAEAEEDVEFTVLGLVNVLREGS